MDPAEKQRNYELAEKLLSEQNFGAAVVAGVVATILSAGIYGIVKSLSEGPYYSILAGGVGIIIGITMQFLGRGIDRKFAFVAAIYALLGCVFGNMFAVVVDVAQAGAISPFNVLLDAELSDLYGWMLTKPNLAELMFWIIGIGGAVYFARRPLTRAEGLALYIRETRR